MCVCVCDNSKSNQSRNMKLEYIVGYENIDIFEISIMGMVESRSRSLWDFEFFPFTTKQTIRSHNSNLVQSWKLLLFMYVHLIIIIHNIYEYCHA